MKTVFAGVDEIGDAGFTHVVISEAEYTRYFKEALKPEAGREDLYLRDKVFYRQFMDRITRVWRSERGKTKMRAGVEVFEIR